MARHRRTDPATAAGGDKELVRRKTGRSSRKTVRIEHDLDANRVAGFLRALADAMESGDDGPLEAYGLDLGDFRKLKVGLRRGEGGDLRLKITIKEPRPEATAGEEEPPAPVATAKEAPSSPSASLEYKKCKKRMKATFALVVKEVEFLPEGDRARLEDFLADCRTMVGFTDPAYGSEYYDAFTAAARDLAAAWEAGDREAARAACRELARCKKECHGRYKT